MPLMMNSNHASALFVIRFFLIWVSIASYGNALVKDGNGEELVISNVDVNESHQIFKKLAMLSYIPYKVVNDGCQARAHEMCRVLMSEGYKCGKIFALGLLKTKTPYEPSGRVIWTRYHVSVFLLRNNLPVIFDPSLFDYPVSAGQWLQKLIELPGSRLDKWFYSNAYHLTPYKMDVALKGFKEEEWSWVEHILSQNLKIQKLREPYYKDYLKIQN